MCVCVCVYLPTPLHKLDMTQGQFFKWSLKFSLFLTNCHTNVKKPSLSYSFPIAEGRIIGFIPSPRVLVLCEIQDLNLYHCPFPTTIIITSHIHTLMHIYAQVYINLIYRLNYHQLFFLFFYVFLKVLNFMLFEIILFFCIY